jgi:hypothetical protein
MLDTSLLRWLMRQRRLMRIGLGVCGVLLAGYAGVGLYLRDDAVRRRVVDALAENLDSDVTLESLSVRVFPTVRITGTGLSIHRREDPHHVPPVITAARFEVQPGLWHVLRGRARYVEVEGLRLSVPRREDDRSLDDSSGSGGALPSDPDEWSSVILSNVVAMDAELVFTPRDLDGPRRAFSVHSLHLREVGFGRPMSYEATMTNPQPKGRVVTQGRFGPFDPADPGASPVADAAYTLTEADFNTIKGLAGTVESEGQFEGVLDQLHVEGSTHTPNFQLDETGQSVELTTTFTAVVDGTNGDVHLEHVEAGFEGSRFTASGAITGAPGQPGRRVELDLDVAQGRIEDFMRLAVPPSRTPMFGDVALQTRFVLPHGTGRAVDRMELDGRFDIERARLASTSAQARVSDLSRRAQGKSDDAPPEPTRVEVDGAFTLRQGVMRLTDVTVGAPGIDVTLSGTYELGEGALDLRGTARMDASISNLADGVKGFLLKLVSPLFRKDGAGAVIPIRISGTHDDPDVGLDAGRVFGGGKGWN